MTPEITLNLPIAKPSTSRLSRVATTSARVLLGLLFFVSGFNGLFHVLPEPSAQLPAGAAAFAGALLATGYMFPLIMATQLVVGTLLLSNRFVPLALTLLAPFMVNSIAFHVFLERNGLPIALIILALQLFLVWQYRRSYAVLLTARAAQA